MDKAPGLPCIPCSNPLVRLLMRMPHDTIGTGAPHACSLFYFTCRDVDLRIRMPGQLHDRVNPHIGTRSPHGWFGGRLIWWSGALLLCSNLECGYSRLPAAPVRPNAIPPAGNVGPARPPSRRRRGPGRPRGAGTAVGRNRPADGRRRPANGRQPSPFSIAVAAAGTNGSRGDALPFPLTKAHGRRR